MAPCELRPLFFYSNNQVMNTSCYDKIIGFSSVDCECVNNGRPADYNESKSGLYIDSLEGLEGLSGLEECDKTVWDALEEARANAIKAFIADTNALLGKKYRLKRKIFRGVVGEIKPKDTYSNRKNYAVVRLTCAPVKGGVLRLRNLSTVFSATGSIDVELHSNLDGLIGTYTLSTQANRVSETAINVELPTYSKYLSREGLEYYLVFEFDAANMPLDNQISCGCGGFTPSYDRRFPYFNHVGKHKGEEWADWCMVGGNEVNSLTELIDMPDSATNNMYGLVLDIEFICKVDEVLCESQLDFEGNPLALGMAYAIYYKTGFLAAQKLLNSDSLQRATMVNNEALQELQIFCNEKYNEHVNYIVDTADVSANDCLSCKEGIIAMSNQGLFS